MSERVPYVGMDVLFTAVKDSLSGGRLQSEREGGPQTLCPPESGCL